METDTPSLFCHESRGICFVLVVDDFEDLSAGECLLEAVVAESAYRDERTVETRHDKRKKGVLQEPVWVDVATEPSGSCTVIG